MANFYQSIYSGSEVDAAIGEVPNKVAKTDLVVNPTGSATDTLKKVKIYDKVYTVGGDETIIIEKHMTSTSFPTSVETSTQIFSDSIASDYGDIVANPQKVIFKIIDANKKLYWFYPISQDDVSYNNGYDYIAEDIENGVRYQISCGQGIMILKAYPIISKSAITIDSSVTGGTQNKTAYGDGYIKVTGAAGGDSGKYLFPVVTSDKTVCAVTYVQKYLPETGFANNEADIDFTDDEKTLLSSDTAFNNIIKIGMDVGDAFLYYCYAGFYASVPDNDGVYLVCEPANNKLYMKSVGGSGNTIVEKTITNAFPGVGESVALTSFFTTDEIISLATNFKNTYVYLTYGRTSYLFYPVDNLNDAEVFFKSDKDATTGTYYILDVWTSPVKSVTLKTYNNVIANPTLTGTETVLTGLTIDNVKYKIPSGGDVTAAGNNSFTGTNTFNSTLTAKSGITVPGSGLAKTVYDNRQILITNSSLGVATYNFEMTGDFVGTVATKENDCFTYIEKTAGSVSSTVILSFTSDEAIQIFGSFERTVIKVTVSESGNTPKIYLYPYGVNTLSSTQKYCIFASPVYSGSQYVLTMSVTSGQTAAGGLSKVTVGGSSGTFEGGIISGATGFTQDLYVGNVSSSDGTIIPDPAYVKIGKNGTIQLTNASGKHITWSYIGFQKNDSTTGYDYGFKIPNKTPTSNNQIFVLATLDDVLAPSGNNIFTGTNVFENNIGLAKNKYFYIGHYNGAGTDDLTVGDPTPLKLYSDNTGGYIQFVTATSSSSENMQISSNGFYYEDNNTGNSIKLNFPSPTSYNQNATIATTDDIKIKAASLSGTTLSLTLG